MAATKSQGRAFTLFMAGATVAAAGIAYLSTGSGKLALVLGLVVVAVSFGLFVKIKPEEGVVPENVQPAVMRLVGVATTVLGWLVVLFGLHLSSSVSGRLATTIVGLVVSLVGVLYVLPTAANKNAIWKA